MAAPVRAAKVSAAGSHGRAGAVTERHAEMYGTVVRFRPIPGKEQEIIAGSRRWAQERGTTVGFVTEYLLTPENGNGEWIGFVVFESRDAYRNNAADPAQEAEYRDFRAHLQDDPIWTDGAIVAVEPASVPL